MSTFSNKGLLPVHFTTPSYDQEIQRLQERITRLENNNSFKTDLKQNNEGYSPEISDGNVEETKAYIEKIESDSYLYLSVVLSYNSMWLMLRYTWITLGDKTKPFKSKILNLMSVFVAPLLYIPGIATPFVQILCFYHVYNETTAELTTVDIDNLIVLKLFILIIFGFMVANEASQAMNAIFYCYFEARLKNYYFIYGCIMPQLFQLSITFGLLYVTILLLMATDDAVSLLQNFAALYVILELDNIMMNFIRLTKLNILLIYIDRKFKEVRDELSEKQIYRAEIIRKILTEDLIEVDYETKPDVFKNLFIYSRILLIGGLLGFGIWMWVEEVYKSLKLEA